MTNIIIGLFLLCGIMPNPIQYLKSVDAKGWFDTYDHSFYSVNSPWTWTMTGPDGGEIISAISHPGSGNTVLALSSSDVWRSVDGGASWTLALENCFPQGGMLCSANRGFIVDGNDQVWATLDAGSNWTSVHTLNGFQAASFDVIDTIVYMVDSSPPRILRSTNCGLTWQTAGTVAYYDTIDAIAHVPANPAFIWAAGFMPNNDSVIFVSISTNGGSSWGLADSLTGSEVIDIQMNPFNIQHTLINTDNGIYQATSAGGPWSMLAEPFAFGLYQAADIEFTGNDTICVSSVLNPGAFTGRRSFGVWLFSQTENREVGAMMSFGGASTLYAGSAGRGVFKSTNEGATWIIQDSLLYAHTLLGRGNVSAIHDSAFYFINFGGNVYRTFDWGNTWTLLPAGFLSFGTAVEVAPSDPNRLYAAAFDIVIVGMNYSLHTIFQSNDGGTNWMAIDSTYPAFDLLVTGNPDIVIAISDTLIIRNSGAGFTPVLSSNNSFNNLAGYDTAFTATDESTYVSYDQGSTWQGLINRGGLLQYDRTRGKLYICSGLLYTYDLGSGTLDSIDFFLPGASVSPNGNLYVLYWNVDTVMIARSFDGAASFESEAFTVPAGVGGGIAAGNDGVFFYQAFRGMWVSTDITAGLEEGEPPKYAGRLAKAPTLVKQGNNSVITLHIDRPTMIKAVIYDLSGRELDRLHEGELDKGIHQLSFSTAELSRGVYFIAVKAGDQIVRLKQIIF